MSLSPPDFIGTISYTARYGKAFVYHAILAALAWAILAPLSHLIAQFNPATSFSTHRAAMLTAVSLTTLSYLVGYFNASDTPSQHALLVNGLMLAIVLQSLAGALRPKSGDNPWRRMWARAHRMFGACVLVFAFFVVNHSLQVFNVDGWLHVVIVSMLVFGGCAEFVTVLTGLKAAWNNSGEEIGGTEIVDDTPLLDESDVGDV